MVERTLYNHDYFFSEDGRRKCQPLSDMTDHPQRPCFNFTNRYSPVSGQGVPTSTQLTMTDNSLFSLKIHFEGEKHHVIFEQNHLILGQAMDKIFGQLTSAP